MMTGSGSERDALDTQDTGISPGKWFTFYIQIVCFGVDTVVQCNQPASTFSYDEVSTIHNEGNATYEIA